MFLAIARIPEHPEALKEAAFITGMAQVDVTRSLTGILPRVLIRATEEAEALAARLEQAGFVALVGDVAQVTPGQARVEVRSLEWLPQGFVAVDSRGQRHECPAEAIALMQRGIRTSESSELIQQTERRFDPGRALLSGGLILTRKVEKTVRETETQKEAFLVIHRKEDHPDLVLQERRLNYACLAPHLQPATFGNFMAVLRRIQTLAPRAPLDDRLSRPGFVANLPLMAADPIDLALYLVSLAHQRGC
jgi:hypothetical protein